MAVDDTTSSVAQEMTPLLRGYAVEAGLPSAQAKTLSLEWSGTGFVVRSTENLDVHEYGDGKGPSPRPIHKAMNQLAPDLEKTLQDRLLVEAVDIVSPW